MNLRSLFLMYFPALALSFVLMLGVSLSVYASNQISFVGKAYSLENDELVYIENHTIDLTQDGKYLRARVAYTRPNGDAIANKTLTFNGSQFAPNVDFHDVRSKQKYLFTRKGKGFAYQSESSSDSSNKTLDIPDDPLVADGGFDRFIAAHLEELAAGDRLEFEMLALTRGEYFSFEAEAVSATDTIVRAKIQSSSWVVRVLVEPIFVTYDRKTSRLLEYRGLTNIEAELGDKLLDEHFEAKIKYEFPD